MNTTMLTMLANLDPSKCPPKDADVGVGPGVGAPV